MNDATAVDTKIPVDADKLYAEKRRVFDEFMRFLRWGGRYVWRGGGETNTPAFQVFGYSILACKS